MSESDIDGFPEEWGLITVDEVRSLERKAIISGPFGSNISSKYFVREGIPVIRGSNLSLDVGKKFIDDGFVFISEEKARELDTWATKNDIIFTAVGTIGQVGILKGSEKYAKYVISNKQLRLRVNISIVLPVFAYYWFAGPLMVSTIQSLNTGSSVPLINLGILRSLPFPVPPKMEQEAIVEILSSLDDKIDLLHRQNKTLEELAQTIFRECFVEGAEEGILEDEFEFVMGQSPPGSTLNEDGNGMAFYQGRTDFGFRFPQTRVYTTAPIRIARKFDTLVSVRAPVGDINVSIEECCLGRGVAAVRHRSMPESYSYSYYKLHSLANQIKQFEDNGTVFGSIGKDDLGKIECPLPTLEKVKEFQLMASPIDDRILSNVRQIHTLTSLRDTLLPKLMSGEVRVLY